MSKYMPRAGNECQMIYIIAEKPQWINCFVKAVSDYGVAVDIDVIDEGRKTLWFDDSQIGDVVAFRPIVPQVKYWVLDCSVPTDKPMEMVCLANLNTHEPDMPLSVIYKNEEGEIFSLPAAEFLQDFVPAESQESNTALSPGREQGEPGEV